METAREILIVSSHHFLIHTLEESLRARPLPPHARVVSEPTAAGSPAATDLDAVLIAPQAWVEMGRWVTPLAERFRGMPWLLFADLRTAGLFLPFLLKPPLCTIVSARAEPEEIPAALRSLLTGSPPCDPPALLARFNQTVKRPDGRVPPPLTPRELQHGCGVSLGLSNEEIAECLGIKTGTVKNVLYGLYQKLGVDSRKRAVAIVERTLASVSTDPSSAV